MKFELAAQGILRLLLIAGVAMAVFYFYLYRREARRAARLSTGRQVVLWALRIGVAVLVLVALSDPRTRETKVSVHPPVAAVLLDVSASMSLPASEEDSLVRDLPAGDRDRFRSAQKAIDTIKAELSETHDVRVFTFSDSPNFLAELPQRADPSQPMPEIRYVRRLAGDDDELKETPLLPDGRASYVGSSITKVIKQLGSDKVAAAIVLSDGQLTGGTKLELVAREILKARGVNIPVHAVTLGSRHPLIDLSIDEVNVGSDASLGDVLSFHVNITNQLEDSLSTTIRLSERNADVDAPYKLAGGFPRALKGLKRGKSTIDLSMVPEIEGKRQFRIELGVPIDPREVDDTNNAVEVTVRIVKRTLRVLLVCGEPQREYFYMVPALLRDPIIQLSTFLQAADVDYTQQGNEVIERLPTTLDAWVKYDVVVLYDVDPNGISVQQIAGIEHMVAKGGGLLFVAGRAQGLAKLIQVHAAKVRGLLPVEIDKNLHPNHDAVYDKPFEVERTPQGRTHPIMFVSSDPKTNEAVWQTFPKLYWHHPVVRAKSKAITLLKKKGADDCLMAVQRYGEGAVFCSTLDSLWLWRYPHESYDYDRFWTRAIRYLGESRLTGAQQQVALGTHKQVYAPGEQVIIQLQVLDPALMLQLKDQRVSVQVTAPGDERFYVSMTAATDGAPTYRGTYLPRRVGTMGLRASQAAPEGDTSGKPLFDVTHSFEVKLRPLEMARTHANYDGMRKLAETTDGLHFCAEPNRDGARGDLGLEELASLPQKIDPTPLELSEEYPLRLWDGWTLLVLFVVLAACEWSLRKWWGLL